ncbi:hypothetical protein ACEN9J_03430 [Variovorax sp. Varisp41]|uniref:hypothetical protein n=1 Tax=Variovorax sp. Varisp41 TaxID=3243033 RepID=UPI0039B5AB3F
MKTPIRSLVLAASCACAGAALAAPPCADEAVARAKKLLVFHFGEDDRIRVGSEVKELPPLRNPANKAQQFRVLEVWGSIYKGNYRMRLIYHVVGKDCTLMGQEILEYASL